VPGVPGIVGGHNGRIAWNITAGGLDGTDLALVERDPEHSSLYRHGPDDTLKEFTTRVDTIQVRFGELQVDTFLTTTRGRVGLPPSLNRFDVETDGAHFLELRDVSFDYPDGLVLSSLRMANALNTEQGLTVGALVTYPNISFSIADTSGNIGYQTAARIALRPESHARFVDFAPADDNARTYLQIQENPRVVNPPSGRIVTANQLIIGEAYPHYLSDGFVRPTRAHRIDEVLDGPKTHDVASFVAMQNDAVSPVARELLPLMLEVRPADPADQLLLEPLTNWDYNFDPESVAPTIFTTWLSFLNQKIREDDLPGFRTVGDWTVAQRALGGERSDWCDDRRTEPVESCKQLLSSSLTESREALKAELGTDTSGWAFGNVVPTRLPHMGFDRLPGLGDLFSREVAVPGGFASLFYAGHTGRDAPGGISTFSHSNYQGVYDLADLSGGSRYITPGGVSGHFKSPYYDNLTEMWVRGDRITLNPEQIEEKYRLILQPNISQ
jgi:penicillin amidase